VKRWKMVAATSETRSAGGAVEGNMKPVRFRRSRLGEGYPAQEMPKPLPKVQRGPAAGGGNS
jgi:hypothetical protein